MGTVTDNERAYYTSQLSISGTNMSLQDLRAAFFANPPAGGGGGGLASVATSGDAGDLTGVMSIEQMPAGSIVAIVYNSGWPANPTTRTDIRFNYIGGTAATPPANARAGDIWDYAS